MEKHDLVVLRPEGLYCPLGDFYIDPWRPVDKAVITHAHGDHAHYGNNSYLAAEPGLPLLRARLGEQAHIQTLPYGQSLTIGSTEISFHPAGHVHGAAQIRINANGRIWVLTGDFRIVPDETTHPWEPVKCETLITESTFGLPIYKWPAQDVWAKDIASWWRQNLEQNNTSILLGYSLGKAQRLLAAIAKEMNNDFPGHIIAHGAVARINQAYKEAGVKLPSTVNVMEISKAEINKSLVIAPPSAMGSTWLKRFTPYKISFASGWMALRGTRRRKGVERGFVVSDHADWDELNQAVKESQAERVIATHGYAEEFSHWLNDQGVRAQTFRTEYGNEEEDNASVDQEEAVKS